MSKLSEVQGKLHAPKGQTNTFGKYKYRSCEDILEAVKPLLGDATIVISDSIEEVAGRVYVKATATFKCGDEIESVTAFAREAEQKKGMDSAQVTGATSSYARKYALNGLLLIDDNKDSDSTNKGDDEENELKAKKAAADKLAKELAKNKKAYAPHLLKLDVMALQQAFETHGYVSDKDDHAQMLDDLLSQVNSTAKLVAIKDKAKELHAQVEAAQ